MFAPPASMGGAPLARRGLGRIAAPSSALAMRRRAAAAQGEAAAAAVGSSAAVGSPDTSAQTLVRLGRTGNNARAVTLDARTTLQSLLAGTTGVTDDSTRSLNNNLFSIRGALSATGTDEPLPSIGSVPSGAAPGGGGGGNAPDGASVAAGVSGSLRPLYALLSDPHVNIRLPSPTLALILRGLRESLPHKPEASRGRVRVLVQVSYFLFPTTSIHHQSISIVVSVSAGVSYLREGAGRASQYFQYAPPQCAHPRRTCSHRGVTG
jgi:hypothetical protein